MARKTIPSYRKQRSKKGDRAFVELGGVRKYLGLYASKESRERYGRVIAEWEAAGGHHPVKPAHLTIVELGSRYVAHAESYYTAREVDNIRPVLRALVTMYGSERAMDFGPLKLRALRHTLIDRRLARSYINAVINKVRRLFRWGVSHGLVEPSVLSALESVDGLKRGRSTARETEPVKPVPEEHIEAVRCVVSRQVRALIDLQLFSGARPGELWPLKPCDLNMSGAVWKYEPVKHKCAHRGQSRVIFFGPQSQEVIRPFLSNRPVDGYLFSPREAVEEMHKQRHADRQTPMSCGNTPGSHRKRKPARTPGEVYSRNSFGIALARACDRAGVPRWHAYQLRHNSGTRLRAEFGIEIARQILGHRNVDTTLIYAEVDQAKAADIMAKVG